MVEELVRGTASDPKIFSSTAPTSAASARTHQAADWNGSEYAQLSKPQRAWAKETLARLKFKGSERVLDVGCGDGHLTRLIADMVPYGRVVGIDPAPGMVAAAREIPVSAQSGPEFIEGDVRELPFSELFDIVVSFNALHWVPQQQVALRQISRVMGPGSWALLQMECASDEHIALQLVGTKLAGQPEWAPWFSGFPAPYVLPDPSAYASIALSAGFIVDEVTVTDCAWDFGSREQFERWAALGAEAWTDRLPPDKRAAFVNAVVEAYSQGTGRPGVWCSNQMRVWLRK